MKTPILDEIIRVMEEVAESSLPFSMPYVFESSNAITESAIEHGVLNIHNCGTSCCVIGYAVLDAEVRKIANVTLSSKMFSGYQDGATTLWKNLEHEIGEDFADSIASSYQNDRLSAAEEGLSDLQLDDKWLLNYSHVSSEENNEDPSEAVRYMKKLREVLQFA